MTEIKTLIARQPTCGYRRIPALLRSQRREQGGAPVNVKRVYRIMKAYGLLLDRHAGAGEERRHDGRIAVDRPDTRWCSDGFEIGCDNGEKVRIADINAPETHGAQCPVEQTLGDRATLRLIALLNAGPFDVVYKGGQDEDGYGRKLRVIERKGRSLGDDLVVEGLARRWDGARRGWCT